MHFQTIRYGFLSAVLLGSFSLTCAQQAGAQDKKEEKVYKTGGDVMAPKLLSKVEPKYTDEARDAKIQGTVLLSVVIGADGHAHDMNVVTTPDAGLGTKAVEAVQQWTFQPGTLRGEPVPVQAQIEVNFKLK